MKVLVFLNGLGIGGTEKAACRWVVGLTDRGHKVRVISLSDGPRREYLTNFGIAVDIAKMSVVDIIELIRQAAPDVIHAHAPGGPHEGDILGEALAHLPKIPVVQTNIFGRLDNPSENSWVDFRLFISWTSCVQAARRSSQQLDESFFRRASVAVYPLDPDNGPSEEHAAEFRRMIGVSASDVLFGRFSRPEPNKWMDLPIRAFRRARRANRKIKLLLREPPPKVSCELQQAHDNGSFVILSATSDGELLRRTMAATDIVLHTSCMGESFGYGIAEPMNLGRPVITNSVPWLDQAQIELVRHGECGFVTSTTSAMSTAILLLAKDYNLRLRLGAEAQRHIRAVADPEVSLDRLEHALSVVGCSAGSQRIPQDLAAARCASHYLDREQYGHTYGEQIVLRLSMASIRLRSRASPLTRALKGRRANLTKP